MKKRDWYACYFVAVVIILGCLASMYPPITQWLFELILGR